MRQASPSFIQVLLLLGIGLVNGLAEGEDRGSLCEEQEAVILAMGPRTQVAPKEDGKIKGATLEQNALKAMPGYTLEKKSENEIFIKPGGPSERADAAAKCNCSGEGRCEMSSSDDIAVCSKDGGQPCHGKCTWRFVEVPLPSK